MRPTPSISNTMLTSIIPNSTNAAFRCLWVRTDHTLETILAIFITA
jgi:hypothetical protein